MSSGAQVKNQTLISDVPSQCTTIVLHERGLAGQSWTAAKSLGNFYSIHWTTASYMVRRNRIELLFRR